MLCYIIQIDNTNNCIITKKKILRGCDDIMITEAKGLVVTGEMQAWI